MKVLEEHRKQWQPWINLHNRSRSRDYRKIIKETPSKFRPLVAAILAVAKWHPLQTKFRIGHGSCGLCVQYRHGNGHCGKCPLPKKDKGKRCTSIDSLYTAATYYNPNRDLYRSRMFKALYSIYVDEYEKLFGEGSK